MLGELALAPAPGWPGPARTRWRGSRWCPGRAPGSCRAWPCRLLANGSTSATLGDLGERRRACKAAGPRTAPGLPDARASWATLDSAQTAAPWLTRRCHGKAASSVRQKTRGSHRGGDSNAKADAAWAGSLPARSCLRPTARPAQTEIQWWHAMTGANNEVIVKLANDFNASQKDYKVVPTYKGSYADTHERRHRRVPRRQRAAHHAGVRGRHRHHDVGHRRREAGARADEGGRRDVRSQGLSADHHRLLLDHQGRDAVDSLQLVQHGDVVQQGRLQEGRPRSRQAAQDLARGVRGRQEAEGRRPSQLRLRQCLGDLGQPRAALGLAQRAARHQGQRHGRLRHGAEVQQPAAREASARTWSSCRRTRPTTTRAAPTPARAASPPANARSS